METVIKTCEEAARLGGAVLLDWQDRFSVQEKGPADLVTQADLASQDVIRRLVQERFAGHAFLGEESPDFTALDSPCCWIVDPLDGTTNYVHGLPNYAVSVAYARHGMVEAGAVFDPLLDECFSAVAGGGAYCNGRRLATSPETELSRALVAVSFPTRIDPANSPEVAALLAMIPHCQAFRRMGSAALNLCYVAAGRLDAYWSRSTKVWDVAAGALLVSEAGGALTGPSGEPFDARTGRFLAAATQRLHSEVRRVVGDELARGNASIQPMAGLK